MGAALARNCDALDDELRRRLELLKGKEATAWHQRAMTQDGNQVGMVSRLN